MLTQMNGVTLHERELHGRIGYKDLCSRLHFSFG